MPVTVGRFRRQVAERLANGLPPGQREAAKLDARLITARVLGIAPEKLLARDEAPLSDAEAVAIEALVSRRLSGEPVARLLGSKEFWGLPFALSSETLVPRPETEMLVELALQRLGSRRHDELRILDLGTGSGAILVALLSELPQGFGVGVDLAEGAIATAATNAATLGLSHRASFFRGNWADALEGSFNLVISNPPYVVSQAIAGLSAEVKEHDPLLALDGGPDGLDAYRQIANALPRLIRPDGRAFLEIGSDQGETVGSVVLQQGLKWVAHADLAGLPRVVEVWP